MNTEIEFKKLLFSAGKMTSLVNFVCVSQNIPKQDEELTSALNTAMVSALDIVGTIDPRFKCTVVPSGSAVEGTQVDTSDFDYLVCLHNFGKNGKFKIEAVYQESGETLMVVTDPNDIITLKDFTSSRKSKTSQPSLNVQNMKGHMYRLFLKAITSEHVKLHDHLRLFSTFNPSIDDPTVLMKSPSYPLKFFWQNSDERIQVAVDFVLAISIGKYNEELENFLGMNFTYKDQEVNAFISELLSNTEFFVVGRAPGMWRISWNAAETKMMTHMPANAKLCYVVMKYLCKSHFDVSVAESYVLKNILFNMWFLSDGKESHWKEELLDKRIIEMIEYLIKAYRHGLTVAIAHRVSLIKSRWEHSLTTRKYGKIVPALEKMLAQITSVSVWNKSNVQKFLQASICSESIPEIEDV